MSAESIDRVIDVIVALAHFGALALIGAALAIIALALFRRGRAS